jgi:GntR family transcriptional regulator, sialic acid-inducible nan operon repressor
MSWPVGRRRPVAQPREMISRRVRPSLDGADPIRRRKLSRDVLERLLALINSGELKPGHYLPSERQLTDSFKVGRPAVREALQELQRMGLIVINQGDGARVVEATARTVLEQMAGTAQHILATSPQSLEHLKEARLFFEMGMARMAAARATDEDVRELAQCIAEQEAASDNFNGFLKADMAFHRRLAETIGNPIFVAVTEAMLGWLTEYHVGLVRKVGRERKTVSEHRQILERIAARDVDGAAAAMHAHLTRAQDLYVSADAQDL